MKNIRKLVSIALIGVIGLSLSGCKMIQKTPEAISKTVVATVNGEKITLGGVDEKMQSTIDQLKQQYGNDLEKSTDGKAALKQQRQTQLEQMIQEKVVLKKAADLKLIPEKAELDKEVDAKLADIKKVYKTDDEFNNALKSANYTLDTLKEYLATQIKMQAVFDKYLFKDIKITDADIEKYYNENKTQYTQQPGANMSHILVDSEDKAKSIKAELDKGAKFEELAAKYGTDGTKDSGGSLGYVPYDSQNYDKDFLAAAKKLKEGEVSGPVKTQYGWHIIKVAGIQTTSKTQELSAVKASIKDTLETNKKNEIFKAKYEEWKKELKVVTYDDKL
ncbi:peptidylprolyl isomerase [Clostridium folliculivorans]|uniref:peptidylprolyl isomerase n=1 Tax=Clostridium folliculivorans TaxID=2886038 RepID=A0A9W5Y3U5_9CLOT|nr:peptidylprolyl isomerase [Clostridium folliculivorans]GKU26141.1 foldase protein PrsA [Clostridium folliculivorans]GKU28227.1 foldase protein PrsA [Clostridium folliculivorans]